MSLHRKFKKNCSKKVRKKKGRKEKTGKERKKREKKNQDPQSENTKYRPKEELYPHTQKTTSIFVHQDQKRIEVPCLDLNLCSVVSKKQTFWDLIQKKCSLPYWAKRSEERSLMEMKIDLEFLGCHTAEVYETHLLHLKIQSSECLNLFSHRMASVGEDSPRYFLSFEQEYSQKELVENEIHVDF